MLLLFLHFFVLMLFTVIAVLNKKVFSVSDQNSLLGFSIPEALLRKVSSPPSNAFLWEDPIRCLKARGNNGLGQLAILMPLEH